MFIFQFDQKQQLYLAALSELNNINLQTTENVHSFSQSNYKISGGNNLQMTL